MKRIVFLKVTQLVLISSLILLFGFSSNNIKQEVIEKNGVLYLSNTIVVKLKDIPVANLKGEVILPQNLANTLTSFGLENATLMFPEKQSDSFSSLGRIVIINYGTSADPYFVSSKIKGSSELEWVEPKFVYQLDFIPNDPSYGSQYALSKISAALAWDINQGDTSIVIGIVDTGVDWDHPDLAANIWRNWDETPGNGTDDDNNGYVDDIRGWDFGGLTGTPDNDPMEDQADHGTHVAGISSAVTNNGVGVASIGFKTKLMPVKVTRNDQRGPNGPYVIYGYEGIVYAADNNAKVINCSWGGGGYSILGQETINYALSQGSLVVAAAGNENSSGVHYPSAYDGVFSVASTTSTDSKSSFSNYGTTIDVCAPGSSIYGTWQNNTYATLSGTSMSSPLAAGLAALVFSQFPSYTALQVGEQVRVNSDNIYPQNPSYQQMLGFGRINAYNTLNNTNSKSVRALDVNFSDEAPGGDGDGILEPGETITVSATFMNYLNAVSSLQIEMEPKNSYSTMVNAIFNAGSVSGFTEFNNNSSKFSFTISASTPQNTKLNFLFNYTDGSYEDFQWISIIGNPTYATQSGNDIAMTITSKGTYAFNNYPDNTQGDGFKYMGGSNQAFEGALILGTSASNISDAARSSNQGVQNNDFSVVQPFVLRVPGYIADLEGTSKFNDNNAGISKIGLTADLVSYSFSSVPNNNFIILEYKFVNTNATTINNLYAALFFDWDLIDGSGAGDQTTWDNSLNYGFIRNTTGGPSNYIGVALLSETNYGFYAIKNDGNDGGFQIYDGFDDSEKWQAISNGVSKTNAGPGDVSNVVSSGPYSIAAGDTVTVAFAVLSADDKNGLDAAVNNARTKYQEILVTGVETDLPGVPLEFSLSQNFPNPFNPSTEIKYSVADGGFVSLKIYDILGNEVATLVNEFQNPGNYKFKFDASDLSSGIYIYKLSTSSFVDSKKMVLIK